MKNSPPDKNKASSESHQKSSRVYHQQSKIKNYSEKYLENTQTSMTNMNQLQVVRMTLKIYK